MSEIRFLTSSDEHLAEVAPGLRKDNYRDAIFAKIAWQGEMAQKFGSNAVLRGGDFWHFKSASKTSARSLIQAIDIHQHYHCPTYSIVGNHDIYNNDLTTIDKQPLGVLLSSGIFKYLKDETFTDGSLRVRVIGVDYTSDLADDRLHELVRKRPGDSYTIAFIHALAAMAPAEKIQSFFDERIFDYRDLVFDGCPDVYIFGHYHKDQGIVDHLGIKFINLGAISRGALTFENIERKPKVGLIKCNSQGIFVEEQIIPHGDASDIFDFEKKKKFDNMRKNIDEFIQKFKASSVLTESDSVNTRISKIKNSPDYTDDFKSLLTETMEAAEAGLIDD